MTGRTESQRSDCTFCRIVRGEVEALVVLEDELFVAFLDRRPLFPGHVLLVPRTHVPDLEALPAELAGPLLLTARLLAEAQREALGAHGTFLGLNDRVSQSVPHMHLHVVPRRPKDGLRGFFWPRSNYENEAAEAAVREALRESIGRLRRTSA
jgi:histidine triad (HIT) family protein